MEEAEKDIHEATEEASRCLPEVGGQVKSQGEDALDEARRKEKEMGEKLKERAKAASKKTAEAVNRAAKAVKESIQEATEFLKGENEQAALECKGPEK